MKTTYNEADLGQPCESPRFGEQSKGEREVIAPTTCPSSSGEHLRLLLQAREQQQQLIAYEIHDGLAQLLTGVSMQFQAYKELQKSSPDEAREAFDTGMRLLTQSIEETHHLIAGLRPQALDHHGIRAAIEDFIEGVQRDGGPAIEFESRLRSTRLAPAVEHAIFRIVQEAVNNACQHSQTMRVRIDLSQRRSGHLWLTVRDWGIGFDVSSAHAGSYGLDGMRERTRLLGGQIVVESTPGQGTQISVELPTGSGNGAL